MTWLPVTEYLCHKCHVNLMMCLVKVEKSIRSDFRRIKIYNDYFCDNFSILHTFNIHLLCIWKETLLLLCWSSFSVCWLFDWLVFNANMSNISAIACLRSVDLGRFSIQYGEHKLLKTGVGGECFRIVKMRKLNQILCCIGKCLHLFVFLVFKY